MVQPAMGGVGNLMAEAINKCSLDASFQAVGSLLPAKSAWLPSLVVLSPSTPSPMRPKTRVAQQENGKLFGAEHGASEPIQYSAYKLAMAASVAQCLVNVFLMNIISMTSAVEFLQNNSFQPPVYPHCRFLPHENYRDWEKRGPCRENLHYHWIRLSCTADNQLPVPKFQLQPKHILSVASAQIFRVL